LVQIGIKMDKLADKLIRYATAKQWHIDTRPGVPNIFYIEGSNADGTPNADKPDGWNDRRIVVVFDTFGKPWCSLNGAATTEPGVSSTNSKAAQKLGGVARIQFGQFRVWRNGYHKGDKAHRALVQVLPLDVHRDFNRDGKRTGDKIGPATGINQHGTRPGINSKKVGGYSAGCLVGQYWATHLDFMDIMDSHPDYIADKNYLYYTAVINGDEFGKFK